MARRRYGKELGFRSLEHEPTNELGVVMLFSLVAEELGYRVVHVHSDFPDVELRRIAPDGTSEKVEGEFEFRSSQFQKHEHDTSRCELIICWRHDWKECPLHVIELCYEVRRIMAKRSRPPDERPGVPKRDHPDGEIRSRGRKKPETAYPESSEPVIAVAKRIAATFGLDEQAVYQQMWRNRNMLPLRRESSGVLSRGPRNAYLMESLDDEELVDLWQKIRPSRPASNLRDHLSISQAAEILGFHSRQALSRKIRGRETSWVPDCKEHRYCYTRERVLNLKDQFELCSVSEQQGLLTTTMLREVMEDLGIKGDRHNVLRYTKAGQLHYFRKAPGQVKGGLRFFYHPDDVLEFISRSFGAKAEEVSSSIKTVLLRHSMSAPER